MPKYKVKILYGNDEEDILMADGSYDDAIFDNESDAEEAGQEACSNCELGAQILNMSNPGDYPYDKDTFFVDYEIIEIEEKQSKD